MYSKKRSVPVLVNSTLSYFLTRANDLFTTYHLFMVNIYLLASSRGNKRVTENWDTHYDCGCNVRFLLLFFICLSVLIALCVIPDFYDSFHLILICYFLSYLTECSETSVKLHVFQPI